MAKRKTSIADQVRREIKAQGLSCYRIAKECNLHESTVGRFVNAGGGLNIESLDRVARLLGLELVRSGELTELRRLKREG